MATVLMLAVAWWFLSRRKRPLLLSVQGCETTGGQKIGASKARIFIKDTRVRGGLSF